MRRLRREVPVPEGAGGRIAWALAFSAAVHAAAILVLVPHRAGNPFPRAVVISARLVSAPVAAPADRAPPMARASIPKPESAPVAEPAQVPAQDASRPANPMDIAAVAPAALDDTYYAAHDLDVYPRAREPVHPSYPAAAFTDRVAGAVTLLVLIDEGGRVTEASVVDARPEGVFDEAARRALQQAVFAPAERMGRPSRSRILIKVEFDPDKP